PALTLVPSTRLFRSLDCDLHRRGDLDLVFSDPTTLSIAALSPRVDVCELCSVGPETLRTAVHVRHARGGAIAFAGCDRCAAAMRDRKSTRLNSSHQI